MSIHGDLMAGPPPTLLPDEPQAAAALAGGEPAEAAAAHPTYSAAWGALAEGALERGATIEAYAYARTGYHRGLDALRRNGWKGHGPIPWSHAPNQGFLRCLAVLAKAAAAIGETSEAERCEAFLRDSDPEASAALGL